MAMRSTSIVFEPSSQFRNFRTPRASFDPKFTPNVRYKTITTNLLTSTAISSFTLLTSLKDGNACRVSKDQIITSPAKVVDAIEEIQELGSGVAAFSPHNLQTLIKLALPILQKIGVQGLKIASPVIEEVYKKTHEAIESSGINPEPVYRVAKTVGNVAKDVGKEAFEVLIGVKPISLSTLEIIVKAEPTLILGASAGLLLTYLFLSPIWSMITFNLRGYRGKLSAAQTLDLLSTKKYLIIDIRFQHEKNSAGVPLLPSTAKSKMISVSAEELPSNIKDLVRNTKDTEAGIIALKISYLKMIKSHSNIVIMDSNCDMAKIVAKELTNLGFKNCWVMAGGFSGSRGWLQSQLREEPCNISTGEILSESRAVSLKVLDFIRRIQFLRKT